MSFDPFSEAFLTDPYPRYAELRRDAPCHYEPARDVWMISRHADVIAVLRDPGAFSSAGGAGYVRVEDPERGGILISTDPPRHTALRRFIQPAFSPEATARMAAFIEQRVEHIVDRALEQRTIDVVRDLAEPLPIAVSSELLGLPTDTSESWAGWSDIVFQTMGPIAASDGARIGASIEALVGFLMAAIQRGQLRTGGLAETILRDARATGSLTDGEAFSLLLSIFAAGIDTTVHAITNGLAAFSTHPAQWEQLRAMASVGPAVEEMLRFDAPIQAFFRSTTRPVELAGVRLPEGARVMALFGSANRDPDRFERADEFRIDRNAQAQLAFGSGIHLCVGAPLARLEMASLLQALRRRVKRLELAAPPVRRARFVVRGYASLPIELVS